MTACTTHARMLRVKGRVGESGREREGEEWMEISRDCESKQVRK
jgi:hypothetical protein